MRKYSKEEIKEFCRMSGLLVSCFEKNGIKDYLGDIYMKSGAGSKITGQFFTPFHISVLNATTLLSNVSKEEKIRLNEPSAGGGGMILAAAKVLEDKGINYQKCLGIDAEVIQGNTLSQEVIQKKVSKENILFTPARMGVFI